MFTLHRYLGLAIALLVNIIGLTGSLIVFQTEILNADLQHRIGEIAPQREPLPIETILNIADDSLLATQSPTML